MRAAMAGDAGAYQHFLRSVAPHVRAVVRSRCRDAADVEDVVQEVLLTIHLKRGSWDQSRPIGPWVAAIARNKLIDALRRRGRRISVPIEDVIDDLPAEEQTSEQPARDIAKLLVHLKDQQREIVKSISLDGNSIRDTASSLQMTEGAVRVALHRALKALGAIYRSRARED
jgi:RNA polymerase sigma-70 factor (ECF subfamily)